MKKTFLTLACFLGMTLNAQESNKYNKNVEEVIVICKTHFDIGFTHRVKDLVHYYQTDMIDKALDIMDSSKDLPKEQQFAWTLPGWVFSTVMDEWDGQSPERRQRLLNAIESGQIICHALPFTYESDFCGTEELVRGLSYSYNLDKKYGMPVSRSGKVTDVPSQTGALATVLGNAGVKFLHIGCNWPSGYVKTPSLYWWEGPDGTRILTLSSPCYGTCSGVMPISWVHPTDPMMGKNLIPAKDWPYKVWPAIMVSGDNSGAPHPGLIRKMFDEIHEKMPNVKVRMGTMDDFYDALMKENPELPVVKADMPDTWIHGVMCDPGGAKISRKVHQDIQAAEVMSTQATAWVDGVTGATTEISKAYDKICLFGEHTWGGSAQVKEYGKEFKAQPADKYKDLEESWEDKTDYIRDAGKIVDNVIDAKLKVLSDNIKSKKEGTLVYNQLPWTRSGWVNANGTPQYVKNIPANGYTTVYSSKPKAAKAVQADKNTIENEYYKIVFDTSNGCIKSLIEKESGKDWVDNNSPKGMGRYMNERFSFQQTLDYTLKYQQGREDNGYTKKGWPHHGMHKPGMDKHYKDVPYRAAAAKNGKLTIKDEGWCQTATLDMPSDMGNHMPASELSVTLYKGQPYVDMEVTIKDKEKDNWPEADWMCMPFNVKQPEFNVYRQLGVMNPKTDIIEGANRHLYAAEYGVTITEPDGSGVAVCPIDHPLVSLGTPGCWKYSDDYVPEKPVVYLNMFNNEWNCNFRYWYPGTWSSRVRIWTLAEGTSKEERTGSFIVNAMEARNPMMTAKIEKHDGNLPAKLKGVELSRKGVAVTAFGADPFGNEGKLLRIWEQSGKSGKVVITLPKGIHATSAQPVNLRSEKAGEPVNINGGKIEVDLKAYAPASFLLR